MNGTFEMHIPDCSEFNRGYRIYSEREHRGPMWFEARREVQDHWGDSSEMSRGVRIIINGWNRFYAGFDDSALATTIGLHLPTLTALRHRNIGSLTDTDGPVIKSLFRAFQDGLARTRDGRKSPVSVAKALSLFASGFLPIWDSHIAFAYHCIYVYDGAEPYLEFMKRMQTLAAHVRPCVGEDDDRSLLKRIDEYNYSKYTMHWI